MSVAIHVMPRSLTVILNNKPHMIGNNDPNYSKILAELVKAKGKVKEAFIQNLLNPKARKDKTTSRIKIIPEKKILLIDDQQVPEALRKQYLQLKAQKKSRTHLTNFWDRLKKNPSESSKSMLFDFLMHNGHTIMADGRFTAYRNVRKDFKDHHSNSMDNSVGKIVSMPRSSVVEDPNQTCASGLHCCAFGYLSDFNPESSVTIEVLVDPADVVSVPVDYNAMKMRVCKFEVYRVVTKIRETKEIKEKDDPKPLKPEEVEELQDTARKELPKKKKKDKKKKARKEKLSKGTLKAIKKASMPQRDCKGHFIKKTSKPATPPGVSACVPKSMVQEIQDECDKQIIKDLKKASMPQRDSKGHFISSKKLKVDTKGVATNGGLFSQKKPNLPLRDAKGHFISTKKKSKKK